MKLIFSGPIKNGGIAQKLLNDASTHTNYYVEKDLPDYTAQNMKHFNIFKGKTEMTILKKVQQISNSKC